MISSGRKTLILDGYNVIHLIPELERLLHTSLEAARHALIQISINFQHKRGDLAKILIVFDGKQGSWDLAALAPQHYGGVEVLFTEGRQKADDKILEILEDAPRTDSFLVVSNDNYIINNARAYGVTVIPVQEFQSAVLKKKPAVKQTGLSSDEAQSITQEYKKILGIS